MTDPKPLTQEELESINIGWQLSNRKVGIDQLEEGVAAEYDTYAVQNGTDNSVTIISHADGNPHSAIMMMIQAMNYLALGYMARSLYAGAPEASLFERYQGRMRHQKRSEKDGVE